MTSANVRRALAAASLLCAKHLFAQGAIALQGYGYPPGQLTVRAATSGGGLGEFDQAASLNPAALLNWGVAGAYMQYSPERRTTSVAGVNSTATVARFPIFSIGLPAGAKYSFGISSSTLLERNYTTSITARQVIRTDSVTTTTTTKARGAVNLIQFGGAIQVTPWLRFGTALGIVTGENRITNSSSIAADSGVRVDSVSYDAISNQSTATFGGNALSFGVELFPAKKLSVAASARIGFRMRADFNDSTELRGDVPNRAGAAARWEVGGSNIAVRYNWEGWSSMKGLGGASAGVFDTKEIGIGAEVPGPKVPGGQMLIRLGLRNRDLPYGVSGRQPKENIFGGGLGFPIGFGRAQIDLGVERASRKVPGLPSVKEHGTIVSFGFRLRT